ncbi:PleD family two-component system response regulator [Spirochaetota bacterium]
MSLILAVDENLKRLEILDSQLKKLGHTVINAVNRDEGLKLARNVFPDLILLNLTSSKIDGFEMLENLKNNKIIESIPIVVLSAMASKENIIKAMKYGIVEFISKKIDINTFKDKINSALRHGVEVRNKNENEQDRQIYIKHHAGKVVIQFISSLKGNGLTDEANQTFNSNFIQMINNETCIYDFRYLNNPEIEDLRKIEHLVNLVPERGIFILCGRYFASITLNIEFEERVKLFISFEDMDLYNYTEGTGIIDVK